MMLAIDIVLVLGLCAAAYTLWATWKWSRAWDAEYKELCELAEEVRSITAELRTKTQKLTEATHGGFDA